MKIWKIQHTNKHVEGAKIAIGISSNESRGVILKPGEFVLAQEQLTASLDSQSRRGFVSVESFDNSSLKLNLGEVYNVAVLSKVEPVKENKESEFVDKLEEAEKNASDYINNKKEE